MLENGSRMLAWQLTYMKRAFESQRKHYNLPLLPHKKTCKVSESKIIYLHNMHFQKHHWIQMVNNGAGQPEIVTDCISHISSEEEHEK